MFTFKPEMQAQVKQLERFILNRLNEMNEVIKPDEVLGANIDMITTKEFSDNARYILDLVHLANQLRLVYLLGSARTLHDYAEASDIKASGTLCIAINLASAMTISKEALDNYELATQMVEDIKAANKKYQDSPWY